MKTRFAGIRTFSPVLARPAACPGIQAEVGPERSNGLPVHLRLVGLGQRFYDDLSRVLLLQLPCGLLGGPPGHLLSQPGRLQTLLLESSTVREEHGSAA